MQLLPIVAALLAVSGAPLTSSPQHTPTPDEARLFDEGTRALAAGDAKAAEKAWRAGYAIAHDPAFLVHIGEAEEKAGEPAQAADSYRQYLREAPDASDRAEIGQRLARLAPAAPAPAPAIETPGEFGGTPPAGAPATGPSSAAPAAPVPPPAAPAAPPVAARADAEHPAGQTDEESGWNRYNASAMIASGVTLALLGTAAFYGAEASSKENDINRLVLFRYPPPQYSAVAGQYASEMADGQHDAHVARVLLVVAAGTALVAAAGFILDVIRAPQEATPATPAVIPAISIAPTPSGVGAQGAWSWRF